MEFVRMEWLTFLRIFYINPIPVTPKNNLKCWVVTILTPAFILNCKTLWLRTLQFSGLNPNLFTHWCGLRQGLCTDLQELNGIRFNVAAWCILHRYQFCFWSTFPFPQIPFESLWRRTFRCSKSQRAWWTWWRKSLILIKTVWHYKFRQINRQEKLENIAILKPLILY